MAICTDRRYSIQEDNVKMTPSSKKPRIRRTNLFLGFDARRILSERTMHYRILSLSLASFMLVLALSVPTAPVAALEMQYFPLAPGSSLIYNSTNDEGSWMTQRIIDPEWEFLGGPYGIFTVHWCETHMLPGETEYTWVTQMWLSKSDDTLLWWGFEDSNAQILCSSPLNYVTEPVKVGAAHHGSTIGALVLKADGTVIQDVPFSANYTIEAIEDVTTPAGTFENCIMIHEEELTPDGFVSFWVWYAPNVGAIQYYYPQQDDRWDKLVSYDVDINNDPWNSWLMPKVPTILLISTIAGIGVVVAILAFVIRRRRG
ncbi:MAG: hypothetical protein EAX81_00190 [Candidatus Thorarchaeota archaeon]|nr:hypothetical protein [Candidatus Thorarchaeota archaeon]